VKIHLEHSRVSDYFAGCVRLFVPRITELFLSISYSKRAQKAMKEMGVHYCNLSVGIRAVCCSEMEQKELHSAALNVQE